VAGLVEVGACVKVVEDQEGHEEAVLPVAQAVAVVVVVVVVVGRAPATTEGPCEE
jgi:hypothetical protein